MRIFAITFSLTILISHCALASDCDPDGVAHQVIACIEEENEARAKDFGSNWEDRYKDFIRLCAKDHPGGGSGGRASRAECVSEKINAALNH